MQTYKSIIMALLLIFLFYSFSFSKEVKGSPPAGTSAPSVDKKSPQELPVRRVPGFYSAAEAYFSPDGKKLIFNAQMKKGGEDYHAYTVNLDGSDIKLINDKGADACSYFFPDGKRLVFTSTRDNLDLPRGNYSDTANYPQGAELYSCNLDGSKRKRLTHNKYYDAEVSISPDGKWILFGRQIEGRMDLWRMRPDGSGEFQITHTPDIQEGGAFYLPDSEHIIFRSWNIKEQEKRSKPMTIYTIKHDGTGLKQITHEPGLNWAPHPSPDGKHFVFVKRLPPYNYEVFLMNMKTGKQTRVTYSDDFDAFPAFSPDGKTINFSSSRGGEKDTRGMSIYLMDISPLL